MLRRHTNPIGPKAMPLGFLAAESCGCRAGARFLSVALVASTIWYGWQHVAVALPLRSAVLHVLIISTAAAVVGKALGILLFRLRRRP